MSEVTVTILYPAGEGSTFDMEYYKTNHRQLVLRVLQPTRFDIEQGLEGQPYLATGRLVFDSMEALQAGMASPDAGEPTADIANFTNVQPQLQIGVSVD